MEILRIGNELLHQKAQAVKHIGVEYEKIAADLLQALHDGKGIGLAGPQIGLMERIFAIHIEGDVPRIFINPSIIETSQELVIFEEGCLSIPGFIEVCKNLSKTQLKHLVLFPEMEIKNTAPAIAAGLLYIDWANDGQDNKILVLTGDQLISPTDVFKSDMAAAAALTQQDKLVVFGLPLDRQVTENNIIETTDLLSVPPEDRSYKNDIEPLIYKANITPNRAAKGTVNYYRNTGIYAFSSQFIMNEYQKKAPRVINPFYILTAPCENSHEIQKGIRIVTNWMGVENAFKKTPLISFENAVAEKCGQIIMIKASFELINAGNWDVYAGLMEKESKNAKNQKHPKKSRQTPESEVYRTGSKNTFVDSDIPVALVEADDLIVVIRSGSPGIAMIAKKGETGKIQKIIKQIEDSGRTELL